MKGSKTKGNNGERELLRILLEKGLQAVRNDQFKPGGGYQNPDIALQTPAGRFHVEVKRVERLNIQTAMDQAQNDCGGIARPVVIHRRNRCPWLVTMTLDDWLQTQRAEGVILPQAYSTQKGEHHA